ncbi:MAG: bifunctional [glutamate--ammonia ligase]-adenylyl-L-tyrosine phosphorylase/[glutamate--ammonia-ligase] adenylyltransferase [Desulfatitalea sp.]
MPPLPPDLQADALARMQAVREAFLREGLVFPEMGSDQVCLERALVFSDFITQQWVRHPALVPDLLQDGDVRSDGAPQGVSQRLSRCWQDRFGQAPSRWNADDPAAAQQAAGLAKEDVMQVLRAFRQREMVRIALRDICGWADLIQTLDDLSGLADATIGAAVAHLYLREAAAWGRPTDAAGYPVGLVVLGLGKMGANELNFSSDVDLIFAYAAEGQTSGGIQGSTSNEAFFTRLCRDLIQTIGTPTADGFVFRVDTRLRPYGDAGPLVMIFDRLEDYYQEQGREWERYALIKARVVAGDHAAGDQLLARLKPFIFRRYLDYGAFDSLREMKGRIAMEVRGKGMQDDIKLGPGGIREIEFFGQMFQLIRGGVESGLQIRPIQQVLKVLVKKRYIPEAVGTTMDAAYVFLRTVENRLQQWADQQTHLLPVDAKARLRLAAAMGFDGWAAFETHLDDHRQRVHAHFNDLLAPIKENGVTDPQAETLKQLQGLWQGVTDKEQQTALLRRIGYQVPSEVLRQMAALKEDRGLHSMSSVGRERVNRLVPMVLLAVGRATQSDLVLGRILDMIRSIQQRTSYLALLLENPSILTHLVKLAGASPWIATFLGLHPVLLDELLDPRTLYRPPRRKEIEEELTQRLAGIDADDLDYQMETLRVFKQVNVLRVAASDITHVLPLMKVSDHLSDIAEVVLEAAVNLCFQQLRQKYGAPACSLGQAGCERGFAVIAYGKLGGLELGYGSDLDLVFVHAAEPGSTSGASRSLDNAQFFSRLGQRVLHLLTTPTGAGVLYEVDMRLRPSGDSGMLVSHVEGFADYQRSEAWTWEHQALIRARAIIGDPALQTRFVAIRHETLTRPRDADRLRHEVADMRERLRKEQKAAVSAQFDIKQGAGGILDIEFLVQYLVLRYAHRHPAIVRWTDNVRLLQALNEAGILDNPTAFRLRRAYLIYRAMVHRLNLAQQSAHVANDRFEQPRRFVVDTWNRFLNS